LLNRLALHLRPIRPVHTAPAVSASVPYLESYAPGPAARRSERICVWGAAALLSIAWLLQVYARFEYDGVPLGPAMGMAACAVGVTFCCACLPAYAVWVDLLHRKPIAVPLIAAMLCYLFWCAAGILLPGIHF
jgi:hypothetical protein